MNKRERQSLVKRAVRAYRMGTGEYESIMDEAGRELDWNEDILDGAPDVEWDRFCKDVEEGCNVPLTPREQKILDNRKRRQELEIARMGADHALAYFNSLLLKGKKS